MCSRIPTRNKVQPCQCLPDNWMFYFDEPKTNPEGQGLFIVRGQKNYRSYRNAYVSAKKAFGGYESSGAAFMAFVGLQVAEIVVDNPNPNVSLESRSVGASNACEYSTIESSSAKQSVQPWSDDQLEKERCGGCRRCTMPRCKNCYKCTYEETVQLCQGSCVRKVSQDRSVTYIL